MNRGGTREDLSFALRAKSAANKNDAYDSPASARSSARSRSASTMANLRATCINDTYIHGFLTCVPSSSLPPRGDLAASENARRRGRHERSMTARFAVIVVVVNVAAIGRVTVGTRFPLLVRSKSVECEPVSFKTMLPSCLRDVQFVTLSMTNLLIKPYALEDARSKVTIFGGRPKCTGV